MTAVAAMALAVPLLLLLYFLKLRRRSESVPSTLFWQQAVRDLEANTPFQRLRFSWLLLVQLLLLLMLIAALARPIFGQRDEMANRAIILIDVSASMSARVADPENAVLDRSQPTRLDIARSKALEIVEQLSRQSESAEAMVIAVGRTARTVHPMSGSLGTVRVAIEGIEPTDEIGHLQPAFALAEVFLASTSAETSESGADENAGTRPARVILLSDGQFEDQEQLEFSQPDLLEFIRIPEISSGADESGGSSPQNDESNNIVGSASSSNIGIVSFAARRDVDDPSTVRVLCGLTNSSSRPQRTIVSLELDGDLIDAKSIELPAVTRNLGTNETRSAGVPGEASVIFTIQSPSSGVLRAWHSTEDALASDDEAHLVLRQPRVRRMILVHPEDEPADPFLLDVLRLLDYQALDILAAAEWEAIDSMSNRERIERLAGYDLVVFDRVSPTAIPPVGAISFGSRPPISDLQIVMIEEERPYRRVLSWDRSHPIMTNVNLDPFAVADRGRLVLPEDGQVLALGVGGPILAVTGERTTRHIIASFPVSRTNWPLHPSFPIFLQNAADYLTLRSSDQDGISHVPGEAVTLHRLPNAREVFVRMASDDESGIRRLVDPASETVTLPPLSRAGIYRVEGVVKGEEHLALNMLSRVESDIRPRDSIEVQNANASIVARPDPLPRDIWPWFVLAALAVLILEWLLYIRNVRR